jgi:hypothetical protein
MPSSAAWSGWEAITAGLTAIRQGRPPWARQATWLAALSALTVIEVPVALARQARWGYSVHRLAYGDFGQYYLWARIGLHAGWSRLYEQAAQFHEWQALGGDTFIRWWPNIDPPPQAWLVAPLGLLPFPVAFAIWMTLILGVFLLTWRLCAPGTGLVRLTYLAAALASYPVMFALMLGQALILVAASVVASWWLLRRGRDVEAGLVLVLIVLKPQLAVFVPIALLVAGYRRAFVAWAVGVAIVVIISVVSLGPDGLSSYGFRLAATLEGAGDWMPTALSASGLMRAGLMTHAVQLVLGLVTLRTVWRVRRQGPDAAITAALVGSMLLTPYVHIPDLSVLLVAAAIFLHANPTTWQRWLLVALYVTMLSFLWTGDVGTQRPTAGMLLVPIEAAWLGSMLWIGLQRTAPRIERGTMAA